MTKKVIATAALLLLTGGTASAQNCLGRPDFDACIQGFVMQQQGQLAQQQQMAFQGYVAQNQEWLQRNYAAHRANGGSMSFEQFAYWGMMTANGTDLSGPARAQQNRFNGQQGAQATVQQGYDNYNRGSRANSEATSETMRRSTEGSIRGNAPYMDPQTGETRWLPYDAPVNQPFTMGGNDVYVRAPNGSFYQRQGNGWIEMSPGR